MGFAFKQFTIEQDRCAMKVGTDGVLLGSWAKGGTRILDIGTGTGLIALMMAQRYPTAHIDAIEIDKEAAQQAKENVAQSPFANRVNIVNIALQNYKEQSQGKLYDAIVSNPPYFENSLKNPDKNRAQARHTDALPFRELMHNAYSLLSDEGIFSIIVPNEAKSTIEYEAIVVGLSISKMVHIKTKSNKAPKRLLMEFRKQPSVAEITTECLEQDDSTKNQWYKNLTSPFYIK